MFEYPALNTSHVLLCPFYAYFWRIIIIHYSSCHRQFQDYIIDGLKLTYLLKAIILDAFHWDEA